MAGKGCYDTLSSGYDTAFRKSLQLSFPVQDWAHDHFVMCRGGTHEAPPLTEELCIVNSFRQVKRLFFSGVVSGKLPM